MSGLFSNSLKSMHKDLEEMNQMLDENMDDIIKGMKILIEGLE